MSMSMPFEVLVPPVGRSGPSVLPRRSSYGFATPLPPAPLTPGVGPGPVVTNPAAGGDVYGTATVAGCNLITNASLRAACIAAAAYAGNRLGLTGSSSGSASVPATSAFCPPGYKRDAAGACVTTGLGAYLPGDVGAPDVVWSPVYGRYGAGTTPIAVQRMSRVCPPGHKLGDDGVCYEHIARKNRMHDPGTKPFLTGGEVNAIRTAKRLEKRFNKLRSGRGALFPSRTKACKKAGRKR